MGASLRRPAVIGRLGHMRLTAGVTAALLLLTLSGCGTEQATATKAKPEPVPTLSLDFNSGQAIGDVLSPMTNKGSADVDISVEATGDAAIDVVLGRDGSPAIRFPVYTGVADAPVAVLLVTPKAGEGDEAGGTLAVGAKDFSFGATFALDAMSNGNANDNGDNLVQRGAYEGPGQLKLQVDGHFPSCRILGTEGDILVEGDIKAVPRRWYTVTCTRTQSEVVLKMWPYGRKSETLTWRKAGATGDIPLADLPLTVGGKVRPDGSAKTSADQFNGAVDDVFLDVK